MASELVLCTEVVPISEINAEDLHFIIMKVQIGIF